MKTLEVLRNRRTVYVLDRNIAVSEEEITKFVEEAVELMPDAFNMKSSRVVLVMGEKQDLLWNKIDEAFDGKVPADKIAMFRNAYGTVLFFYENEVVKGLQEQFPPYAHNFPKWATQSSAMLQISLWNGFRELGLGANLQHYNPVIDDSVKELFDLPESWVLDAQMPFGNIVVSPEPKEKEDITKRFEVVK